MDLLTRIGLSGGEERNAAEVGPVTENCTNATKGEELEGLKVEDELDQLIFVTLVQHDPGHTLKQRLYCVEWETFDDLDRPEPEVLESTPHHFVHRVVIVAIQYE